jgi:hypothetical protein
MGTFLRGGVLFRMAMMVTLSTIRTMRTRTKAAMVRDAFGFPAIITPSEMPI